MKIKLKKKRLLNLKKKNKLMNFVLLIQPLILSILLTIQEFFSFFKQDPLKNTQIILMLTLFFSLFTLHLPMMVLSLTIFLFLIHLPNLKEDQPSFISSPSSLCKILSEKITLHPFQLPVSIGSGVQQMLYVGIRFSVPLKFNRQIVDSSDGGYFALDWLDEPDLPEDAPIILVYHGLAGGSRESYVERFCYYASKKNYRMCVFTCRGCAGTLIKTPRAYSSTNLDDSITSLK
ncbi:alpha/beta hydrolase domain containing protein 1,3, putative, partial [Entamoeba dispar SAW760]